MFKPYKTKNDCDLFRDRIMAFLDGTVSDEEYLMMESHRNSCNECTRAVIEEQQVRDLMSQVKPLDVSPDFKERVLRERRIRLDSAKEIFPSRLYKTLVTAMGISVVVLLMLPAVRESLFTSASYLSDAIDRIPVQYREGIEISFRFPTSEQVKAQLQIWSGAVFEMLGNLGSAIVPWSGYAWVLVIALAAVGAFEAYRFKRLHSQASQYEKREIR